VDADTPAGETRHPIDARVAGRSHEVLVLDDGFSWQGTHYRSLSAIARQITGTAWSGPLFFGLSSNRSATHSPAPVSVPATRPMEEDRDGAG
jgi:hypothetical protein